MQEKHDKGGRIGWSIIKYKPLTTAQRQLQQNDNRLGVYGSNVVKAQILDGSASEVASPYEFENVFLFFIHTLAVTNEKYFTHS